MWKNSKENNKNILKIVFGILLAIFLYAFIGSCIVGDGETNPLKEAIYMMALFVFVLIVLFGGIVGCLFIIYIVFDYLTERNIQITKLNKSDFINDKQLYGNKYNKI